MNDFTAEDFDQFFEALWGTVPFAWQHDLAERVLSRPVDGGVAEGATAWPRAIVLPTAAGKTACIDIAVFALASQVGRLARNQPLSAPRRVFFVVDRRIIVDEAHRRAQVIAQRLMEADRGVLAAVADRLRRIAWGTADGDQPDTALPLAVYRLRGGLYRSEAWARNPLQPAVVASTVDQLGSRLLFRAYGRGGSGMLPVYAGLVGNDSLVFLDEAHCAQPFLQTLGAIEQLRRQADHPLDTPFQPVMLTATPPPEVADPFEDRSDQGSDPGHPLGRRQLASKPASLCKIKGAKGPKALKLLAVSLVRAANQLVSEQRRAIVVFVNRVATARTVYQQLLEQHGSGVVRLTGRMRSIDRDDTIMERLRPLASSQSPMRRLSSPLFVVATQTLEVGADLDFDGLVSECASLDALRQRFGRLNRMGRPIEARAVLVIREDQAEAKEPDPVYGYALAATWAWLERRAGGHGLIDFGIAAMVEGPPEAEERQAMSAPSADAAVLLPAHLDALCQTSPFPEPSPDLVPFLRGPQEGVADVQICWRGDLEADLGNARDVLETLSLCPPASAETLPVPYSVFRRWMTGEQFDDQSTDVEGIAAMEDTKTDSRAKVPPLADRRVIRWRGADTTMDDFVSDPGVIRPGDTLVLSSRLVGSEQLGDLPVELARGARDCGDRAHRQARGKAILRIYPRLLDAWPDIPARDQARRLLEMLATEDEQEALALAEAFYAFLVELRDQALPYPWQWLPAMAHELIAEYPANRLRHALRRIGSEELVLVGRRIWPGAFPFAPPDTFSDEDDASASGVSNRFGAPIPLARHLPGVESFARRFASGCGLPDGLIDAFAVAGLLHDLGKIDPRFQSLLRGGLPAQAQEPLAKSGRMPKTGRAYAAAQAASGYPPGARHELLSVRLAESLPELLPTEGHLRDLVLHLIASHHGRCRPFAPVVHDSQPQPVRFVLRGYTARWAGETGLEKIDSGVADRYWSLVRRYGWWGLAWLEAILRLADHRRSEWEEENDEA